MFLKILKQLKRRKREGLTLTLIDQLWTIVTHWHILKRSKWSNSETSSLMSSVHRRTPPSKRRKKNMKKNALLCPKPTWKKVSNQGIINNKWSLRNQAESLVRFNILFNMVRTSNQTKMRDQWLQPRCLKQPEWLLLRKRSARERNWLSAHSSQLSIKKTLQRLPSLEVSESKLKKTGSKFHFSHKKEDH